jgi:hypothetical protein
MRLHHAALTVRAELGKKASIATTSGGTSPTLTALTLPAAQHFKSAKYVAGPCTRPGGSKAAVQGGQ